MTDWVRRAVNSLEVVGLFSHGRVGKALKPAIIRYGEDDVLQALNAYVRLGPHLNNQGGYDRDMDRRQWMTPEHFVRTIQIWRDLCQPYV
jgi:hypothetical protein